MAEFGTSFVVGNQRRGRCVATWPEDVPELGKSEGDPYDLTTAAKVVFYAKPAPGADDAQAVFTKDSTLPAGNVNDITFGGSPVQNIAYFDIHEADTASLINITRPRILYCELVAFTSAGEKWTLAQGAITVKPTHVKATS